LAEIDDNNNSRNSEKKIDLDFIMELLKKETQIPKIQSMSPDIYKKIAQMIKELSIQKFENLELDVHHELTRLLVLSTKSLIELRTRKLLESSTANLPYPSLSTDDYSKLTDEEKYIFEEERKVSQRKDLIIQSLIDGNVNNLDSISTTIRSNMIIIRFLESTDQFMGVDMAKYGPFIKEDVAILPFENARSLIERKVAVEINDLRFTSRKHRYLL
jgi:DNA replication factor GINS